VQALYVNELSTAPLGPQLPLVSALENHTPPDICSFARGGRTCDRTCASHAWLLPSFSSSVEREDWYEGKQSNHA
jgi:hypothetical protein